MNIRDLRRRTKVTLASAAAGLVVIGGALPAMADGTDRDGGLGLEELTEDRQGDRRDDSDSFGLFGDGETLRAHLDELNGSDSEGTATIEGDEDDRTVTVAVDTDAASPGLPHAQHLHIGGDNACPTDAADDDGDGLVDTAEGQPSYGGIRVSLTTSGDVSPASGLAVDRMPVADEDGEVDYERTFELPDGVTVDDLEDAVIVQHGISELSGDRTSYDGSAESSVAEGVPLEATIPSSCGEFRESNFLIGLLQLDGFLEDVGDGDERDRRDDDNAPSTILGDDDDRRDDRDGDLFEVLERDGEDDSGDRDLSVTGGASTDGEDRADGQAGASSDGQDGSESASAGARRDDESSEVDVHTESQRDDDRSDSGLDLFDDLFGGL